MSVRFTLKCPNLSQYKAKGISPDDIKTMSSHDIESQTLTNERFNGRAKDLGDILISKLKDVDISWCGDGCLVVSCDNSIIQVEKVLEDEGLYIVEDRSEIKHKVRPIDNDDTKGSEEDIDEVFEPKTKGEKKKLTSRKVINKYKA